MSDNPYPEDSPFPDISPEEWKEIRERSHKSDQEWKKLTPEQQWKKVESVYYVCDKCGCWTATNEDLIGKPCSYKNCGFPLRRIKESDLEPKPK